LGVVAPEPSMGLGVDAPGSSRGTGRGHVELGVVALGPNMRLGVDASSPNVELGVYT
jgi:hypothetical protein